MTWTHRKDKEMEYRRWLLSLPNCLHNKAICPYYIAYRKGKCCYGSTFI